MDGSTMDVADSKIRSFWTWFVGVADRIASNFEDEAMHEQIDQRLSVFGDLGWELGPGISEESSLSISPDGDRRLLPLTRRIVAMAPAVRGWEFLPARPPREPALEFAIMAKDAGPIEVDATRWRYVLVPASGVPQDIIVEEGGTPPMSVDDRYLAAVLALDGLLGEERRLCQIGAIHGVAILGSELQGQARSLTDLPSHLRETAS